MEIYYQLFRFLFPLVLTTVVQELGGQVLNGGMARMPQATETLAAYGLAWGLVTFLTSPLLQARQLGLVLVDGRQAHHTLQGFVLVCALLLALVVAALALTPFGAWVIRDLHGVHGPLGDVTREALLWLVPMPLLNGLLRFNSGMLIRVRRTDVVSYATMGSIGVSIATVFGLLPLEFVQARPILLPLLATYSGTLSQLGIVLWGKRRLARDLLAGAGEPMSYGYAFRFFWPLATIMAIQGMSRPVINLLISREPGGEQALAVLTVVYSLAHLPYGWVNEVRNLPTPFQHWKDSLTHIRRFALACGLLSFSIMLAMFWTPLRDVILRDMIGVDAALAADALAPLRIFSFFPLTVMVRSYLHGVALLQRRTQAIAPSGPARLGAIVLALVVLRALGVHGATRGVASLLCGFIAETLIVLWGMYRPRNRGHRGESRPLRGSQHHDVGETVERCTNVSAAGASLPVSK